MPKRSADDKIKYYSAKIKKLKDKECNKKRRSTIVYSSSSDSEKNLDNGSQRIEEYNDTLHMAATAPSLMPDAPVTLPQETSEEVVIPSPEINNELIPDLDPELLQALGDASDDIPVYGPGIHITLAQRWLPILKKGLSHEIKAKLLKEYSIPDNCRLLKAPTLNAEIYAAVADIVRSRDKKIQSKQDQLGLGISAINRAMTLLLTGDDKVQAVKILSDGCRILSDLHFIETQVRTKLITPGLDKSFLSLIQDQDRDETLFGSNLPDKIKASKAIEKQGKQIKKVNFTKPPPVTAAASNSRSRYQGNWTGPPRFPSSSRGGRPNSYRTPYHRVQASTTQTPQTRPSASMATNKRAQTRQ